MDDDDTLFTERTGAVLGTDASLRPEDTISPRTLSEPRFETAVSLEDLPRISFGAIVSGAFPDYKVLATLGEGGMGRVHLAHQRALARDVAVKTLKEDAPPEVARTLLREARLTGSLGHPGVIPVHALGLDDAGLPILVMKRVDGVDFGVLLANRTHAAWSSRGAGEATDAGQDRLSGALEILVQVCLTVEFAHSRGVIHRDIKPENVMVGGFGEVYLLDWGIAVTRADREAVSDPSSPLVGTPAYMAPEMVRGTEIDERTDVYMLGATLHVSSPARLGTQAQPCETSSARRSRERRLPTARSYPQRLRTSATGRPRWSARADLRASRHSVRSSFGSSSGGACKRSATPRSSA